MSVFVSKDGIRPCDYLDDSLREFRCAVSVSSNEFFFPLSFIYHEFLRSKVPLKSTFLVLMSAKGILIMDPDYFMSRNQKVCMVYTYTTQSKTLDCDFS